MRFWPGTYMKRCLLFRILSFSVVDKKKEQQTDRKKTRKKERTDGCGDRRDPYMEVEADLTSMMLQI
jgi:hypothetical protein